eukprot:8888128-Pyramimonas_sp.AAC.1
METVKTSPEAEKNREGGRQDATRGRERPPGGGQRPNEAVTGRHGAGRSRKSPPGGRQTARGRRGADRSPKPMEAEGPKEILLLLLLLVLLLLCLLLPFLDSARREVPVSIGAVRVHARSTPPLQIRARGGCRVDAPSGCESASGGE